MSLSLGLALSIAGPILDPASIPGLVLWLRGDKGISTVSGNVSQWNDQSGNGYNCAQGTSASRPAYNSTDAAYNNQPTISFSGGPFLFNTTLALSLPYEIIIVGECDADNQGGFFGAYGNGTPPQAGLVYTTINVPVNAHLYNGSALAGAASVASAAAIDGAFTSSTSHLYVNNSQTADASGATGTNTFSGGYALGASIGAPSPLTGKIAEVIVYSSLLTLSARAGLFSYLATRYGATWS